MVYYINIRDIKCKISSFEAIINEIKPTVIVVTEIHTDKDYKIEIEGYEPYRNDRNVDGGGILVAVKKELKHVTIVVKKTKEYLESLWIVIDNTRVKLRIGAVYFPQEQDQDLKEIYKILKEQVQEARKKDESVMIVGDFNCKVGDKIRGNHAKESKGGKKLMKFIEKEGLVLGNSLETCSGTWTRNENGTKSILDYLLVDKELGGHMKEIKVYDETKEISPFHLNLLFHIS